MGMIRVPSAVVIGVGTLFFLLYLLPWQHLPSVPFPSPSTSSLRSSSNRSSLYYGTLQHQPDASAVYILPVSADLPGLVTYRAIRDAGVLFNASGSDVLVILHIQKTGGTSFEKHIVQDLVMDKPCICWKKRKRCKCPRPLKSEKTFLFLRNDFI